MAKPPGFYGRKLANKTGNARRQAQQDHDARLMASAKPILTVRQMPEKVQEIMHAEGCNEAEATKRVAARFDIKY